MSQKQQVVEFHFVCRKGLNLTKTENGLYESGDWVVAEKHCNPAARCGAKLALHSSKGEKSYFQGKIIDWRSVTKVKRKRIVFVVAPEDTPMEWVGSQSGEKGYKWEQRDPNAL